MFWHASLREDFQVSVSPPAEGAVVVDRTKNDVSKGKQPTTSLVETSTPLEDAALIARVAGRVQAKTTSDDEFKKLMAERQSLLRLELEGKATPESRRRLQYVRWSIDRIEDARYGEGLDLLEAKVDALAQVFEQVEKLRAQLESVAKVRR